MSLKDSPYFWFVIFITFATSLLFAFLAWRWVVPMQRGRKRWLAGCALGLLMGLQFSGPVVVRNVSDMRAPLAVLTLWATYLSMGFLALILVYTAIWDLGWLLTRGIQRIRTPKPFTEERRRWLWRASRVSIASLATGSTAVGVWEARRGPQLVRTTVPFRDLHPGLEGFKIVQISDLHVGPTITRKQVQRVVALAMEQKPDLIALTGDFVDGSVTQLVQDIAPLAELKAPYGVFFCTGNHEYFSGAPAWIRHFESMGIHVLGNRHELLRVGTARLLLGGVWDSHATRFEPTHIADAQKAITGAPARDLAILLAHQPVEADNAERAGFDLMLSGHTHGGQFFPWSLFVHAAQKYAKGLYRHSERLWVYVNAGTGYWGPPLRFGLPSEISVLTLRRG